MLIIVSLAIFLIGILYFYNEMTFQNREDINKNKFDNRYLNALYVWSFGLPFKWFVDDDERPTEKKTLELQKMINMGGFDKHFTLRSFMTLKVVIMIIMLVVGGITILIMDYWHIVGTFLFNVKQEEIVLPWTTKVMIVCIFLIFALIPNSILKARVKKKIKDDAKDIPVLQMFIILMLRSSKPIAEILYALSKVDTPHKVAFEKSYRVYLRNKGDGMDFLKQHFANTRFVDTFNLLEDIGEYSRSECIRILESNLGTLVEETTMIKRRNDLSRLIFSQASMFIPFIAIIVFGALPLVMMGLNIFANSFGSK